MGGLALTGGGGKARAFNSNAQSCVHGERPETTMLRIGEG
jgi:hypothetical protein